MSNPAFLLCAAFLALAAAALGQPVITIQPADQSGAVGGSATFAVTPSIDGSTFQWRFNGSALQDEQSATLQLFTLQYADTGDYSVVLTDPSGSVTSRVARLTVVPADVARVGDRELRFGEVSAPIWEAPRINDENQTITGDGLTVFYGSKAPGGSGDLDIWMATRPTTSSRWGNPVNLGPTVNSSAVDSGARLSPDGLSLYFASTRPGGSGGYDIWVTTRSSLNDSFGKPVNLGPAVNSKADDAVSDVSADNRTLVFTSVNRAGGQGDYDGWITTRTNAQEPWGPAVNLGAPINSKGLDFPVALSRDGLLLFFKSDRSGSPSAIYVSGRTNAEASFGPPALIGPILNIGPGGADICSLSSDGTTLYVGTYRDQYPDWPQLVQVSITPLPQLRAPGWKTPGLFQCELLGREGEAYNIESSLDFHKWTPWLTTNTTSNVLLSGSAPDSRRFYRVSAR
jgi:hypothetical protein